MCADSTARVAPLVVLPRDEPDKFRVEGGASSGVEDGRVRISHNVGRDDRILRVAEDALCNSYALAHVQLGIRRMRRMTDLQAWFLRRLGRTLLEMDDEMDVLRYDAQGNLNGKLSSVRYGTTRCIVPKRLPFFASPLRCAGAVLWWGRRPV